MPELTTNALAHASSAYLRSAMHQPVHWNEWGEEAFAIARRGNKPVLLDIGAVWCHWCHVMDRESYEQDEVARIINEQYVAVKIDRDERPDVDARYQAAVQAISGQGGWPLTVFLTPEGKPFFGGTYFPPDGSYGRPGFKRILETLAQAYREKHGDVVESAENVMGAISQAEQFAGLESRFDPEIIDKMISAIKSQFDSANGGFGTAPKFPHPAAMDLLIDHLARTGDEQAQEIVVTTLSKMANGGIYDQLGGGFHRYSTDERWIVPHFEKMSYDNSELLKNYVHAYQATGIRFFAEVAQDIIRWMDEWLSNREHGGFYASQDADYSMNDDGDYFTWTLDEAQAALSPEELEVARLRWDIGETGEMHHNPKKNVLWVRSSIEQIATQTGVEQGRVSDLLLSAAKKMHAARLKRPTPFVDKTVYVNWNAMCVSAYLNASEVLQRDDTRHFALRSLDRILSETWHEGRGLAHVIAYSERPAELRHVPGLLDDYVFTALACLDAYEVTGDHTYFSFAQRIATSMTERFYDQQSGGFYDSEPSDAALGALAARRKPFQDAPTPGGNPAAVIALMRLYGYTNDESYREKTRKTLEVIGAVADQFGMFAATYGIAALWYSRPHTQVAVVGDGERADQLYRAAVAPFALNKTVIRVRESEAVLQFLPPALAQTIPNLPGAKDGPGTALVCSNFTCQPPIFDPEILARSVHEVIKAGNERKVA